MSVPLDRYYHFIDTIAHEIYQNPVLIYRFYPHGSKNINDLNLLKPSDWYSLMVCPKIWCNDQEPLAHQYYGENCRNFDNFVFPTHGMQCRTNLNYAHNIFRKNILLHSEKRSQDIKSYVVDDELIPVYFWSHALIARDWFRYAEHENFKKNTNRRFLIYNRAWTGTREYRLKFSDLLIEHGLADQCLTFCNPVENTKHYLDHDFMNPVWRPKHVLEQYFQPSTVDSSSSADFNTQDYATTDIEIVLETLFDDDRLHLTEKSLRPIACGQPFLLAATHGSLQYLRDYGFQTFDTVWDESYDTVQDPYDRMQAILEVMHDITAWTDLQRQKNIKSMAEIVAHNQKHFFSDLFFDSVVNELRENLTKAFKEIKQDPGFDQWIDLWQYRLQHLDIQEFLDNNQNLKYPTRKEHEKVLKYIQQYADPVANCNKI